MTSATVHLMDVDDLVDREPADWRERLVTALRGGAHVVTMYGRPSEIGEPPGVVITAVLDDGDSRSTVLRTFVDAAHGYHALTPEFPALHCFEREIHEQYGVRIADHPWLKPIRFEHSGPAGRDAYGFYAIKGKEVHEVAVGPIHAGVIEPGSFRFMCLGEQVHHLEIHLGYQHRGVETMLLQRDARALAPLVETIAGDTSIAQAWAYGAALEALASVEIEPAIDAARAVMLELERIAMHLSSLAGMAGDIGFLQGATTYGRLRTTAINTSMRICGSRFGRGAIRPAGNGATLLEVGELATNLKLLTDDVAIINDCFLGSRTVRHRLEGVGSVTKETATQLGLVGVSARASGVARDLRGASGGMYGEHRLEPCIEASGDCWARARLRIEEMNRSLAWIGTISDGYPRWQPARGKIGALAPRHLAIAMIEGFRGEVVHALETGADGALVHYKVQDPSLRNWLGLALAVRDSEISDFPICNKSFDLSYCGSDL